MRRLRITVALLVAISTALIAACGGDDEASDGGSGTTKLDVGVIPIVDVAPLYLGIEQGFFEEQGLEITPHLAQGGAEIVPAVQSGDYQIGFSNIVSQLIAAEQGLPLKIISQGVQAPANANEDYSAVLVNADSPIEEPADLEGKTIAVNTLKNIGDVTIKATLEDEGVDISTLEFVEVPFPEMVATLESGRVDAIWGIEPFLTAAREGGARAIVANYARVFKNLTVATYFAMDDYIQENPDVIDSFVAGMEQSLEYAQANPDAVRSIMLEYTEVPKPIAETMKLPYWSADLNEPSIEKLGELSVKYGLIEEPPALDELVYQGG